MKDGEEAEKKKKYERTQEENLNTSFGFFLCESAWFL